jgi:hypothetical protein
VESKTRFPAPSTVNTSSVASGVFTARSYPPDGVSAIGCTWDDSKLT